MSMDFLVALPGQPPDVAALAGALEAEGGAKGSWKAGVRAAGVRLARAADDEALREVVAAALRRAKKKPFAIGTILVLSGGGADGVEAVGEALVGLCGGVFLSEDGDVLAHRASPAKKRAAAAKKAPARKKPAIDVSIPDAVTRAFLAPQHLYALAARRAPTVKFTAVVEALDPRPARVGYARLGGPWDANAIGGLVLKATGASDQRFFTEVLGKIGLPKPAGLYRLSFQFWHVKSVPEEDWRAMLGVLCALGRDTRGILYRGEPGKDLVTHDFA